MILIPPCVFRVRMFDKDSHSLLFLLPFDGCRRFRRNIIYYAINPPHLIDDVVRYLGQQFIRQVYPVGGHPVGRGYGAQGYARLIRPFVAHHADALHRQQHDACLPNPVLPPPFA